MARGSAKNEEMREARLKSIKQAALILFASKGVASTKIQDIAEAVGMSQGLIYHYYSSKEAIFIEIMVESLNKIIESVIVLKEMPLTAAEKIKFGIKGLIKIIENKSHFSQTSHLILQSVFLDTLPEHDKTEINRLREIPYLEIEKIIKEGQLEGTIHEGDPKELSVLFWVTLNGLSLLKSTSLNYYVSPKPETLYRLFIKE